MDMQMKKWILHTKKADFNKIAEKYSISPVIARIIRNRDIEGDKSINKFLNGNLDDLYSPWGIGRAHV